MPNITELEKIPPQNLEAEMSLLGAILIDKDALFKIADRLDPGDFYKATHSDIYTSMLELFAKNEPIDLLTLGSRLTEKGQLEKGGGRAYLAQLANSVPPAPHIENSAEICAPSA